MKILAKRLKEARESAGLKQIDAAKKLGISNGTLSGYERDYRDPDTDILNKMADLYGVSVDWLLGKTSQPSLYDGSDEDMDEELKEFIKEATVWYKSEPETQEERLKIMRRMLEVFKDED